MNSESGLLLALWERQKYLGWSNGQLSREIGVSKSTISLLKAGRRGAGSSVTQAILARFPELLGYLLPTEHSPPRRISA
jgi:DNA-binding Xre family transcriptional regulator